MAKHLPRGIRNNNPLNIRIGNDWRGEVANNTDGQFEQFISMKWGIRAAVILLRNYQRKYNRNTIRKIISSWAPASENNTNLYINSVCHDTGFAPDEYIDLTDAKTMVKLLEAMIKVECGCNYSKYFSYQELLQGLVLAVALPSHKE